MRNSWLPSFRPSPGVPWEKSRVLHAAEAVNGQWLFSQVRDGRSSALFVAYTFSAIPTVARVEIRIRWTGGASPWYGMVVTGGEGYVPASQRGAVNEYLAREVDFRAFDRSGREIFSDIEYG